MMTLPHSAQRRHEFLVKKKSKSKKVPPRKKVDLELIHHRLVHRYTRSLMAGDTVNFWQDIELRIYPDPFCTSCQISSIDKKARSKNPLKRKAHFKYCSYGNYSSNRSQNFDEWNYFSNHPLKLYGMEIITTEEVRDKLDMFQDIFGKVDNFGWWDLEKISAYAVT